MQEEAHYPDSDGGSPVWALGICPADRDMRLRGIHNGINAGRSCWVLAGALCKGEIQGTFATKFNNCKSCDFYLNVRKEEFPNFQLTPTLLRIVAD